MEKKQIVKNKIVPILASFVMVLSLVLVVPAEVEAASFVDDFVISSFEQTFPTFDGHYDFSTVHPFEFSRDYYFGDVPLGLGNTYLVILEMGVSTGATYKYTPNKTQLNFNRYLRYGGERFEFNNSYMAVIVEGNATQRFSLVVDGNLTLSPYSAGDGYVYANSCDLKIWSSGATGYIYEANSSEIFEAKEFVEQFNKLSTLLSDLKTVLLDEKALLGVYLPKISTIESAITNHIMPNVADIKTATDALVVTTNNLLDVTNDIYNELIKVNSKLDINNNELSILNDRMVEIHEELIALHETLKNQTSADKSETDSLKQNSDSQSSQLDNLNQQTQMDKIDVDNVSSSVDANIDDAAISNYGVVLSSITGNGKVVQLMLIVLSIGVVSYVLYGKR